MFLGPMGLRSIQRSIVTIILKLLEYGQSLRIETPSEKVVEATAVIQKGIRGRGMGLRLEAENDRWRCTQLLVA